MKFSSGRKTKQYPFILRPLRRFAPTTSTTPFTSGYKTSLKVLTHKTSFYFLRREDPRSFSHLLLFTHIPGTSSFTGRYVWQRLWSGNFSTCSRRCSKSPGWPHMKLHFRHDYRPKRGYTTWREDFRSTKINEKRNQGRLVTLLDPA